MSHYAVNEAAGPAPLGLESQLGSTTLFRQPSPTRILNQRGTVWKQLAHLS